jgi:uncharacterized repeat protein (TIGR03806 family)
MRALAATLLSLSFGALLAAACGGDDASPGASPGDGGGGGDGTVTPPTDGAMDVAPIPSPFGLDTRPPNTTCVAPPRPPSNTAVTFTRMFPNTTLAAPIMIRQIPGDKTRFFVAQRGGTIVSINAAAPPSGAPPTVLTLPNAVNTTGEGGLLGFVFHPKFAQNGRVFLSYTKNDATVAGSNMVSVIAEMTSPDNGATFGGYKEIVAFNQTTATNHKGGSIDFGLDGYLYFGFGDGGGGGDTYIHGQNPNLYFAKIHRIDIDTPPASGQTYVVPASNPFANGGGQPSTYAWGLRNPFRFTFDRSSGDLWVGDVGQDLWEEVDRILAPGANLAWPCYEATHAYALTDTTRCPNPKASFLLPVLEYAHNGSGKAVIGGVVYRGKAVPAMLGTYTFADEVQGTIFALQYDAMGNATSTQLNPQGPTGSWVHFGEDNDGEAYVVDLGGGKIYRMDAAPTDAGMSGGTFPDALSKTGCVDPNDATKPASGVIPYGVNSPLWSDGADKGRWLAIPDGTTIGIDTEGHLDLPIGSVLMKSFAVAGKRVETRLLIRHQDGGWAGYSYEWNDQGTDATLLAGAKSKSVGSQTWYYPSRSDCFNCHSAAANRTLGMLVGQLNGDYVYPSTNRQSNQLATLDHIGMFDPALAQPPAQLTVFPTPTGSAATLELRAKSYLQANCSHCHRPNGNGGGPMDLRFATALGDAKLCNVAPDNGDLGIAGAMLLVPGNPAKSLLSVRPHALDASRMPPLASHVVDTAGVAVLDQWITSLASCPLPTAQDAGGQ